MPARLASALLLAVLPISSYAAEPRYGVQLEGFEYAYPVGRFAFTSQNQRLEMAYIDVKPSTPNGRTVVLMHGKNFCAGTWESTLSALSEAGYRVIAPDQVGFCKSTKPEHYQYTFQQLAVNTHALLEQLGVDKVTLLGHSTGGMLATRYALLYPDQVEQLALVNPIGLEDWKTAGVPYRSIDQWYKRELKTSAEGIRRYEQNTYYAGQWKPEYDRWVNMLAGLNQGEGKQLVAWNSALIYDMIYTQPVYYEFNQLRMPTLLLIGTKDNTAIGKDAAAPEVQKTLGNYSRLGKETARKIPHATLVEFDDMGHAPQIQDPKRFHEALLKGLADLKQT
ncbi:pimeloyl-ACP methyl ester carboxylesterase [Pseudomonas duriflava]|uniref:Pimeloyl-ACP methyl ester carboxylesterase n=1 Tax=Pseudomonas duriflava TaxID=459528 RepID=A0A562QAR8_9PSED|nr:alpha/beta hydrolase [Pseudomonas duriflava]TWI53865.1 pimeloyl-ACP methyl ester carboxylesterase [Pseudomonas duriflava]